MFGRRTSAAITGKLAINADSIATCPGNGTEANFTFVEKAMVEVLLTLNADRIFLVAKICAQNEVRHNIFKFSF